MKKYKLVIKYMNILLFGASNYGARVYKFIREYVRHIEVSFFLDNDRNKSFFENMPVFHPDTIDFQKNKDLIIVTSDYYEEIKNQLIDRGLKEDIDFFSGQALLDFVNEMDRVEASIKKLERENIPFSILGKNELLNKKTSDTIFLLGSGSTINQITELEWGHIKSHDSWGFNNWTIHDFIPTMYSFEIPYQKKCILNNFISNYFYRKQRNKELNLTFIKDIISYSEGDLTNIKKTVETVPVIKDLNVNCSSEEAIKHSIGLMNKLDLWKTDIFYKFGSSIQMLINTAMTMGYKKIVLCGIDLNNGSNFFMEKDMYLNNLNLKFDRAYEIDKDTVHNTLVNSPDRMPADKIIYLLNELLLVPNNIQLFVMNSASLLHPKIDLYKI